MLLYHGSNVGVEKPRLLQPGRRLDFGNGFYLTSSDEHASRWAVLSQARRREGEPLITVFEFDETLLRSLAVLTFESASKEWLEFVGANRLGKAGDEERDIVMGPVADDKTMLVLKLFFGGILTVQETVERLMPQNLKDQYAFRTDRALAELELREVAKA